MTRWFGGISEAFQVDGDSFEAPVDAVHHFLGQYVAWVVVALHVAAPVWHHTVRRDDVRSRMLPVSD